MSSRDLNQPWKNILSTSNTDLFIEDRDGSNNVGMRGVTDDQIDNKYKPRSSSSIKFGFERGAYKVYTKLSIEPAGNFNYQYKIVEGSIPTGSLTFSSGRGLVRFKNLKGEIKNGKDDWRYERGNISQSHTVVNSGRPSPENNRVQYDYKKSWGPTPPGMWYCTNRTDFRPVRLKPQSDFTENGIMYSGHMSMWQKLNAYKRNMAAERTNDPDLLKDFKIVKGEKVFMFENTPFWKNGGQGADPRGKRLKYKFQLGVIQNTNEKNATRAPGGVRRTFLQVHPDGGPPGSFGCNNPQTLSEASLIYQTLRWRSPYIPYFIEIK